MKFKYEINSKGYLKQRESYNIEFKKAFQFGDSLAKYLKTLVGFSNNKGGEIIFGINDRPRKPIGLKNDKFENLDPVKINEFYQNYFSHEIYWGFETVEIDGYQFGRLWVEESEIKPILCKQNYKDILKEGAIYYRYRGQTTEVKYPELQKILEEEKKKERDYWVSHIKKISEIGPRHIHLLDSYKGELHTSKGKILIDKDIIEKLNFIKEGEFKEKEGAPTLKLIGEITGVVDTESMPNSDDIYPYRFEQLKEKFEVNQHQLRAILWKLNVKGNKKYHTAIKIGKKSQTHKYSEKFVNAVQSLMKRYPNWLKQTVDEYKKRNAPQQ